MKNEKLKEKKREKEKSQAPLFTFHSSFFICFPIDHIKKLNQT